MCKSTDNIFYVYVYLDPRKPEYRVYGNYEFDYEPFYVGKGCNDRAYSHLKGNRYNRHFTNKINKFCKENGLLRQGLHNLTKGHGKTYKGFKCEKYSLKSSRKYGIMKNIHFDHF